MPEAIRPLIIACPRSGTKWIAAVLRGLGLDVQHESMAGADGAVGWRYAAPDKLWSAWHGGQSSRRYDVVWHQVRHPLDTISSCMTNLSAHAWRWAGKVTRLARKPLIGKAMSFWRQWTLLCQQRADWTYRVEDVRDGTPTWTLGDIPVPGAGHCANASQHAPLSWEDVEGLHWYKLIRPLATRYGYL